MSKLVHKKCKGEIVDKNGIHTFRKCGKRFKGRIYQYWLRGEVLIPFPSGACDMNIARMEG